MNWFLFFMSAQCRPHHGYRMESRTSRRINWNNGKEWNSLENYFLMIFIHFYFEHSRTWFFSFFLFSAFNFASKFDFFLSKWRRLQVHKFVFYMLNKHVFRTYERNSWQKRIFCASTYYIHFTERDIYIIMIQYF